MTATPDWQDTYDGWQLIGGAPAENVGRAGAYIAGGPFIQLEPQDHPDGFGLISVAAKELESTIKLRVEWLGGSTARTVTRASFISDLYLDAEACRALSRIFDHAAKVADGGEARRKHYRKVDEAIASAHEEVPA